MLEGHQASPYFPFGSCRVKMKVLEWLELVAWNKGLGNLT